MVLLGCKTSTSSVSGKTNDNPVVNTTSVDATVDDNTLSMLLRRVPGVQVRGNDQNGTVQLAGNNSSLLASNQPLFVVDGVKIGHSLVMAAQMINVRDIKNITVLKRPNETSFYGIDGANGVIVIKTKH